MRGLIPPAAELCRFKHRSRFSFASCQLLNGHKHNEALPSRGLDPCSSAAAFDGWAGRVVVSTHALARAAAAVAVEAKTWLLRVGWRRGGPLLDPDDRPGPLPA